jgi:guanine nucleotide-binding protein subunit alpha
MGLCASAPIIDEEAAARTLSIETMCEDSFRESCASLNMLCLGPSASGKATFLKQMVMLFGKSKDGAVASKPGFRKPEIAHFKRLIQMTTIANMKELVEQAPNYFSEGILDVQAGQVFEYISEDEMFDENIEILLLRLWSDPGIQAAYAHAHEFGLADSAGFFFQHETLQILSSPKYVPSTDHILRVQEKKNGLVSRRFVVDAVQYTYYDVSAQNNRKKKWIANFQDDIHLIMFFVGLDQFDEPSRQNQTVDGVTHAMAEFLEVLEEKSLSAFPILLVFNRHDVFCKKIQSIPPWEYAPHGDDDSKGGGAEPAVDEDGVMDLGADAEPKGPWDDAFEFCSGYDDLEAGCTAYFVQKFMDIAMYCKRSSKYKYAPPIETCVSSLLNEESVRQVFHKTQGMLLGGKKGHKH